MILFVFEGAKAEPKVFESIQKLFLNEEEIGIVKYGTDLPTLYKKLKDNDYDLFRVLPLKENGIEVADDQRIDTMFSQIYLFFDYDFQNRLISPDKLDDIIKEMLDFFSEETENGKLYVNYPMVESLKYTKEMPDAKYNSYTVSRQGCAGGKFKSASEAFAYASAKAYRFIDLNETSEDDVKKNWKDLIGQNTKKANFICNDKDDEVTDIDLIGQAKLFDAQKMKYVDTNDEVAVLNSFPLFLFEYLK